MSTTPLQLISSSTPLAEADTALKNINPWPGKPYPLGATCRDNGTNFAIFSEQATAVDLCLFHPDDPGEEIIRISLVEQTDLVWHTFLEGVGAGLLYGYRVYGEWAPKQGNLFNPNKVLIDPYAKAIHGNIDWHPSLFGYDMQAPDEERYLRMDEQDSAPYVNKAVVIDPSFDWEFDLLPEVPMHESIIYELHVKGMTALNEHMPAEYRGTYRGLSHPSVIKYFKDLGVTAIELLPVHHFVHDQTLVDKGLRNYWGYNSIGYFAPHSEYASDQRPGGQLDEFKEMVKAYHAEGLEVILDVVYNHTAEGNHFGPTISMKGIDNKAYYRHVEGSPEFYMDYTGTGNTLNMVHPRVLQLVMDSLRYWVTEMHVDGFRFDLASALARGLFEVGKLSTFLDTIHQDPIISQVKLIAEPWDVGPGGYQVGNFPVLWAEWNGKYRDNVRSFWRGDAGKLSEFAYRLTGSSDLYEGGGRAPWSSINFITAHDGFTLRDLVSYNDKHNLANGEENNDGERSNESWNCGEEGPSSNTEINQLRERQQRNFLATLLLSQGVPMLTMGDEYGRSQLGNNNVYCQDNPLVYQSWQLDEQQQAMLDFTSKLAKIRLHNTVLHRRKFFEGRPKEGAPVSDIFWLRPDGQEMKTEDWSDGDGRAIAVILNGEAMSEHDKHGIPVRDDIFLLCFNAFWEPITFKFPGSAQQSSWCKLIDTNSGEVDTNQRFSATESIEVPARASMTFVRVDNNDQEDRKQPWLVEMSSTQQVN